MEQFSRAAAGFEREHGLDIARWSQFAAAGHLPFEAMWFVVPPRSASLPDEHPEAELAVVVQGSGDFETADRRVPATAGTAVLFGPGERHTVHNPSAEPLLVLSAYWIPDEDATATDAR